MPTRFSTAVQGNNAVEGDGINGATGILGTSDSGQGINGHSVGGIGVNGISQSGTGVSGTSSTGIGLLGSGGKSGVQGETASASDSGVLGQNTGTGPGVSGTSQGGIGVSASSQSNYGAYATSNSNSAAFLEITNAANTLAALQVKTLGGTGIDCISKDGIGIDGRSTNNIGVSGNSQMSPGVVGTSQNDIGVSGSSQSGTGVQGQSTSGFAGKFIGNVDVQGTLTKSAGTFKIDHPLDPARKYLSHAFVESAEMKNIYDGLVVLDACGEATVELPRWFEALNRDFRYQLTCLGGYAPVYIAEEIQDHRFKIAGGKVGMKVCWLVTGIRQDAYAQTHPLIVEQEKGEQELDSYRHPELYS